MSISCAERGNWAFGCVNPKWCKKQMSVSCATGCSGLLRRVPTQLDALCTYGLTVGNEVCLAGWRSGNAPVSEVLSSILVKGTVYLDLGPSCLFHFLRSRCLDRLPPSKSFSIHPYILPFEAVPYSRTVEKWDT
jgi:hypothetical protein